MFCYPPSPIRFSRVHPREDEVLTQNNLAFDLSQMDELRMKGVPISTQTLQDNFYDGEDSGDFDNFNISPDLTRDFDVNDAWNLSKSAHEQLTKHKIKLTDLNPK